MKTFFFFAASILVALPFWLFTGCGIPDLGPPVATTRDAVVLTPAKAGQVTSLHFGQKLVVRFPAHRAATVEWHGPSDRGNAALTLANEEYVPESTPPYLGAAVFIFKPTKPGRETLRFYEFHAGPFDGDNGEIQFSIDVSGSPPRAASARVTP